MKKGEIKQAKNNELIKDYVVSYSILCLNYNSNRATKQIKKHCNDLEEELLKRELLTAEDIRALNK